MAYNYNRIGKVNRKSFSKISEIMENPNLLEIQRKSYEEFLQRDVPPEKRKNQGLEAAFQSIFPLSDFHNYASLEYSHYTLGEPKYSVEECQQRDMTYAVPLKVTLRLILKERDSEKNIVIQKKIKDIKEQEIFVCELPLMTSNGTFIINGAERVIVSQLHRSPGVSFGDDEGKTHASGKKLFSGKVIPYRGSWLEFEFDVNDVLYVRIDKRKRLLATIFLRALGLSTTDDILKEFFGKEEVALKEPKSLVGKICAEEIIDSRTGEVLLEAGQKITKEDFQKFESLKIKKISLLNIGEQSEGHPILKTLEKDNLKNHEEALLEISSKIRPGDPITIEGAKSSLKTCFLISKNMISQK